MKSLFEILKHALKKLVDSESGEFLSTRRKAHLLYAEMYTRVGNEAQAQPKRAAPITADTPVSKDISTSAAAGGRAEIAA